MVVVADKLIAALHRSSDEFVRKNLVTKLTKVLLRLRGRRVQWLTCQIADQFAPDNEWFINTMTRMFVLGGNLVPSTVAYNLLVLVCAQTLLDSRPP